MEAYRSWCGSFLMERTQVFICLKSNGRELFMNGPFEFRVLEQMKENPKEQIPSGWRKFIDKRFAKPIEEVVEEEDEKVKYRVGAWTFVAGLAITYLVYRFYFLKRQNK